MMPLGSGVRTYQLGNWPAPFGIVLVLDRLSALMLVLTSVLGIAALLYSLARWHRMGPRFHTIFQLQLMGLNGAFLTGDLFNLFVFFEVLLAASYGLVLHGDGVARVRAGLAYIAINLMESFLFLIGASLVDGVTGTLTIVFGTVGVLAAQSLPRLAGCSVLVSSGTLIAAIGTGGGAVIGSALFYLVSSTLGIAALFLLIELVERMRDPGADVLAVTMEAYGEGDDDPEEVGEAIPATVALLGGSFIACALLLAGLPPLAGFIGKFGMTAAMLKTDGGPGLGLDADRPPDRVGPGDPDRHDQHWDQLLLGPPGRQCSQGVGHRDGPSVVPSAALPRPDRRRRSGHALHGGNDEGSSDPAGLRHGRAECAEGRLFR
jgi:formate hydrogenlyase subunit 3/multisubunit Na+/H+ antiporter MnhD subunit